MKRLTLIAAIALALTACATTTPTATIVPPSPAIVALANPPTVLAPAPKPDTVTLEHTHWSLTVPATSGWTVNEDTEEGCTVTRVPDMTNNVLAAKIFVISSKDVDDASEWATGSSLLAEQAAGQINEVINVQRRLIDFHGTVASLTQVTLKNDIFVGDLAVEQESTKTGYAVVCIAPNNDVDAKLMATITKTFTLK